MTMQIFFFMLIIPLLKADCSFTNKFSEEHGGFSEFRAQAIIGMKCSKSYCDDKQLRTCEEYRISSNTEQSSKHSEEQGPYTCPDGKVLAGIKCDGKYCDNMYYYCAAPLNFDRGEENMWTGWFSEEHGYKECPADYVVAGVDCAKKYCDNLRLHCYKVESKENNPAVDSFGCNSDGNCEGTCSWGAWFSDRRRLIIHSVDYDHAVVGARCRGSYCDDLSLLTCNRLTLEGGSENTNSFSEEKGGRMDCYRDQPVVSGMSCSHHYCDDKRLKCKRPRSFTLTNRQANSLEFSEEQSGGQRCPRGSVVTGIRCRKSNCDKITLKCTFYEKKENSYGVVNGGLWKFVKVIDPWETASQELSATFHNEKGVTLTTSEMIKFEQTYGKSKGFSLCGGATGKGGGGPNGEMCVEQTWHQSTTTGWERTLTESVEERAGFSATYSCHAQFTCPAPTHIKIGDELNQVVQTQSKCHLYQWVAYTKDYATGQVEMLETCNYDLIEKPGNKPRCVMGQCDDSKDCQRCLNGPIIPRKYFKNQDHVICAGHDNDYVFGDKPDWIEDWNIVDGFGMATCDDLTLEQCEQLCDELFQCVHFSYTEGGCCYPFKTPVNNCRPVDNTSPYAEYVVEGHSEASVGNNVRHEIKFQHSDHWWALYAIVCALCASGIYLIYEAKFKKSSINVNYGLLDPEEL